MVCCTTLWWDGAGKGRGWKTAAIIYCWQQQRVRGRTAQLSDISSEWTGVADLDSRALALTKEASGNSRVFSYDYLQLRLSSAMTTFSYDYLQLWLPSVMTTFSHDYLQLWLSAMTIFSGDYLQLYFRLPVLQYPPSRNGDQFPRRAHVGFPQRVNVILIWSELNSYHGITFFNFAE